MDQSGLEDGFRPHASHGRPRFLSLRLADAVAGVEKMVSTPVQTIEGAEAQLEILAAVFDLAAACGAVSAMRPALLAFKAGLVDAGIPADASLDALLALSDPHDGLTLN
jgi:hypothetical protein